MAQLALAAAGAWAGGAVLGTGVVALGMTGPAIGWAVGSMVGSMFGPKQKSQGPRLNDLVVNGTEYGQPIPILAGAPRLPGQVIWASEKRETAKTTEVGKGGSSEYTNYTYDVDLLIMLCDHEIDGITRIWMNNEVVYSDEGTKSSVWSRMTVYTGEASQLPDPTYEVVVGSGNAPAYRGRGCVFIEGLQLGSSGQIPNLEFEIGTLIGEVLQPSSVSLYDLVTELMLKSELEAANFDISPLIDTNVDGLKITQVSPIRNIIEMLQQAYFFDVVSSDRVYIRPRATIPVATIPYTDLALTDGDYNDEEPLKLELLNEIELPSKVSVQYYNSLADHQIGNEYADRLISSQESLSSVQLPLDMSPQQAKKIAEVMLQESIAGHTKTSVVLHFKYSYLEPGDVIFIENETNTHQYRFRIASRRDNGYSIELECISDDPSSLLSEGITSSDYVSITSVVQISESVWHTLDIPVLRDGDSSPGYYISAKKSSTNPQSVWPGANVIRSWDSVKYAKVNEFLSQCVIGECYSVLGNFEQGNIVDEINTLTVYVGLQQLSSTTRDVALSDKSINAAIVGNEIVQFVNAELIDTGLYKLSGFLRGRRGTEQYISSHSEAERFVLLDGNLRRVSTTAAQIGADSYLKVVTYNRNESTVTPESFTDSGTALKPFSPVALRINYIGTGVELSWIRRTRFDYRYTGTNGISVPIAEDSEQYRIRVYKDNVLLRTEIVASASFTYTTDMQTEDGLVNSDTIVLVVSQISAIVGDGFYSSINAIANN